MGILNRFNNTTKEIPVVCNVDLNRYLGTWYEVARLPHGHEHGLDNITATYNLMDDGNIEVINSGFKNGEERVVKAVAWVPDKECTGWLLVSFIKPFKSDYRIIKLDEVNYSYAVVTEKNKHYLWFLSRKPEISDKLYNDLILFAEKSGFDISKIIKVNQDRNR